MASLKESARVRVHLGGSEVPTTEACLPSSAGDASTAPALAPGELIAAWLATGVPPGCHRGRFQN